MRDFRGLLKVAGVSSRIDSMLDEHSVLGTAVGIGGYSLMSDPRVISELTGTEHLFHGTPSTNVPSIFRNGILVQKSFEPNSPSAIEGFFDRAKGYTFLGRTKKPVRQQEVLHDIIDNEKDMNLLQFVKSHIFPKSNRTTLDIRIPYDDFVKLGPVDDPAWASAKRALDRTSNPGERFAAYMDNRLYSPSHTYAFAKDIDPKYIKGSSKFKNGFLRELKGIPSYALKNPRRFLSGAVKAGVGASVTGMTVYSLIKKLLKHRQD